MEHHNLDIHPIPKEKAALYINEPWLIDETVEIMESQPDTALDNIRVYVPLDLNKEAILRRLRDVNPSRKVLSTGGTK